tara:strand:+ start:915 stop:1100 length:186 start_codon:yes stop_codon:yes gene_type:complete
MHAITKLRRDIAFSRRRTQVEPSQNVEKLEPPTMELAERKRKKLTAEYTIKDQNELLTENL